MNEDIKKSLGIKSFAGQPLPNTEDHPLHILNNQVDPEKKVSNFDISQKPLRTYDRDIEEALSHLNRSKIPSEFQNRININVKKEENKVEEKVAEVKVPIVATPPTPNLIPKPNPVLVKPLATQTAPSSPTITVAPKKQDLTQVNLRTYESDVANALSKKGSTVADIAIAESKRKNEGEESISNKPKSQIGKNIFIILLSIIFIVAGAGGGYYLYLQSPLAAVPVVVQKKISSVVKSDSQKVINIGQLKGEPLTKLINDNFNKQIAKTDFISEFILTQTEASTTYRVSGAEFLSYSDFKVTDTLKRSLTDRWMIGAYALDSQGTQVNIPFVILTTDFFQNAFAGMHVWEGEMPEDLADLFGYRDLASIENLPLENTASSTATTSQSFTKLSKLYNVRGSFKDKLIMNRDVRELISPNGNILLLYTFIDKNTILITTSEELIPALIDRIEKQTYLR